MIELLSPAGSLEKLEIAYNYGADAAYMGVDGFSLRSRSGNISLEDKDKLLKIKKNGKKLYGALNIFFNEKDISELNKSIEIIKEFPFDALIVSDLGCASVIQEKLPDMELHLSTQANSINSRSVKMYNKMGFKRIILGRETPLDEIKMIKDANSDVELEAFVHGAMCMAYSGRCLLSAHMSKRSANKGGCAHSCRWNYNLKESHFSIEEGERPNEFYPIEEFDKGTVILSSQDLCMIDYVDKLIESGLDSLKIEGRMKSIYYTATVTRAYRKAIDYALGKINKDTFMEFRNEIMNVSHREFSTGFYFPDNLVAQQIGEEAYQKEYLFLGSIKEKVDKDIYAIDCRNQIRSNQPIEVISPDIIYKKLNNFTVLDENKTEVEKVDHGKEVYIKTKVKLEPKMILRRENK